jgi:murein DD-endopeptidase MepM/ murein hydrolase activator NlpD
MEPATPQGRGWRKLIATAAGVATMCVGAGIAAASGGGVGVGDGPQLRDVLCVQKCAGARKATVGSLIRLEGKNLAQVQEVQFADGGGRIRVAPAAVSAGAVEAAVPSGAVTGTVRVNAYGTETETPNALEIVPESAIPDSSGFKLTSAAATPHKTYFDGIRAPQVSYLFEGLESTAVRIDVVARETREVVRTWVVEGAVANAQNVAEWDGRTSEGTLAGNGEYKFRIGSAAGETVQTTAGSRFGFYKYRFPIAAKHGYGDGFGAGRGHQGQDVFARCGATLRAARGGRVQWNKTHSAAGNYLVIDGKRTKKDFMYAHMLRPSPLQEGERVRTGERIGQVGDTGNASGCHLHFEVWSGPGWYEGGQPLPSVRRILKTWDVWS